MLCLSFDLPEDVAFAQTYQISSANAGIKRPRLAGEMVETDSK